MGKRKREREAAVLLTPEVASHTLEFSTPDGGLMFRKKILPLAEIDYPMPDGTRRRVNFDRAFHNTLIDSFRRKAYDSPTLQLADAENRHNMDVTRTAGEVVDIGPEQDGDVDGPGLYANIRARNEKHAALLREMPNLGVSAQIKERLEKVDGRRFKAALRHVLVTADPRVSGLGAWRTVSLSADEDGPVIDMTAGNYKEFDMPKRNKTTAPERDAILSLSDEDIEAALEAAAAEFGEVPDDDEPRTTTTSLSTSDRTGYLDLAARLEERDAEVAGIRARLVSSDWKAERLDLSNAGVPKAILDDAEELLAYPGESYVSLSDEDGNQFGTDARAVVRKILNTCRGMIDLSDDVPGSGGEPPLDLSNADDVDGFVDQWEKQSGV